ncbi:hypothetical protein I9018_24560 [Pseudomonas sp. MPFS]|uniref:DUF7336 domain-containing protein n=1 Tax=Pseudomonas sp. MPFS TaxID=2795724 RepID=UPI001F137F6D|nr:hypothetical protein [Pseudomonas sp. MPFS]UMZ10633.1 hypothetical protein I9018_24560 [Pseudomonas sp. MPFS]
MTKVDGVGSRLPSKSFESTVIVPLNNRWLMIVYILQHVSECEDREDVKIVGIYSAAELANEAALNFSMVPGFKDFPQGFSVDPYELDRTFWKDGF